MEIGEIAHGELASQIKDECPFSDSNAGVDDLEDENTAKDDMQGEESSGGLLGKNLLEGTHGTAGTWSGTPPKNRGLRVDTRRTGVRVSVPGTGSIPSGVYGFSVAAHHLIPGEASLSASRLKSFMVQGESVEVQTSDGMKRKTLKRHIGYNVNGSHNGTWLPGNYYIRTGTSPIRGSSWSDLGDDAWCLNYVAAVVRVAGGQFHDAHTKYSSAVEDLLNKISDILAKHECNICQNPQISPPARIKERLYGISGYLRGQVEGLPAAWKRPWFTSDRWRDDAFTGNKPSQAFLAAHERAAAVLPERPVVLR
jgi:hypothetical protein